MPTPVVLGALAVLLAGPLPGALSRWTGLRRTPAAAMLLWQSTALAAVLNLRFWVFAATFFGLTGLALTRLGGPAARGVAPLVAVPVGLAAGFVAYRIFATLGGKAVGAVAPSSSYIGREGVLLLPVSQTQRGKLRLRVGATEVDLLAETDDDVELPIGASVLVCGVRGQCLVVARNPAPSAGPATA